MQAECSLPQAGAGRMGKFSAGDFLTSDLRRFFGRGTGREWTAGKKRILNRRERSKRREKFGTGEVLNRREQSSQRGRGPARKGMAITD